MHPALLAMGPPLVAGAMSYMGQRSANRANRAEAALNRSFQERMSSTSWQRSIKDMEAAGINPAVAYSKGGASSPGGSVAAQQRSEAGEGVSSALGMKMAQEQFKLMKAQVDLAQSAARKARAEGGRQEIELGFDQARRGVYFEGNGRMKPRMIELLLAQHGAKMAGGAQAIAELKLKQLSIPEQEAIAALFAQIGDEGKAIQMLGPLLLRLLGR